jgi:hypothetical protein
VGILAGVGRVPQVFLPAAAPPVASQAAFLAFGDAPGLVLPGKPVVVGITAFNLM